MNYKEMKELRSKQFEIDKVTRITLLLGILLMVLESDNLALLLIIISLFISIYNVILNNQVKNEINKYSLEKKLINNEYKKFEFFAWTKSPQKVLLDSNNEEDFIRKLKNFYNEN